MARAKGLEALQQLFQHFRETKTFTRVLDKVRVVSGGEGKCVCELTVDVEHENAFGSLHGGLTATLVDNVSTAALMTTGRGLPGVSVDMNITYMRPAMHGETILIDAQVYRAGRTLAFTSVDIRRKSDNALLAQGRHTKAFPDK